MGSCRCNQQILEKLLKSLIEQVYIEEDIKEVLRASGKQN
jgi:hypothetical protein